MNLKTVGTVASKVKSLSSRSDKAVGAFTETINKLQGANEELMTVADEALTKANHYLAVRDEALNKHRENRGIIVKLEGLLNN
jgi:hypothetical protein